jgi:hypothetical protein
MKTGQDNLLSAMHEIKPGRARDRDGNRAEEIRFI